MFIIVAVTASSNISSEAGHSSSGMSFGCATWRELAKAADLTLYIFTADRYAVT